MNKRTGIDPDVAEAIEQAIEAGGGPSRLAKRLTDVMGEHVGHYTVCRFRHLGVSAKYVPALAAVTGVPAHRLCPRYFPRAVSA